MRVLFVCTGNSFRSPVAEALTRKYRPHMEVESAGINPANSIAGNARELLKKECASKYAKPKPEPVTKEAVEKADLIVVMGRKHEKYLIDNFKVPKSEIRNWNIKDPINPDIRAKETFRKIKEKLKNW